MANVYKGLGLIEALLSLSFGSSYSTPASAFHICALAVTKAYK